ncbi:NAD(P)-dependent oxidoreductase [Acetobacter conturbans]|uniref:NAD(P)-dependent oxidoreductase n=1 Tax=Acetobacter conturbans TaxID=1737472 RepID=UPI00156998FA
MSERISTLPKIVIAHAIFDIKPLVDTWDEPTDCVWVKNKTDLLARLPEADILVTMTLWENRYLEMAPKLKFVQAMSSGMDQYDVEAFRKHAVHLASARGVNANAVAEHALALMLSLSRRLPEARDDQHDAFWRKMGNDPGERRRELAGSHVVIVGFGEIGRRIAQLCLAFGQRVTVVRRNSAEETGLPIRVVGDAELAQVAGEADYLVLACPATPETTGLINAEILQRMKPSASVINVARGSVVVEDHLIAALHEKRIAAAALDTFQQEPLPSASPLWKMGNVVITPHGAGDTTAYETRVADILHQNIHRLTAGSPLINQIA